MFPPATTSRPPKRSLRELVRGAVDTALELATLGEATALPHVPSREPLGAPERGARPGISAPTHEHPHRRHLGGRPPRKRRPGGAAPRAQVCVSPVRRPARRD